MRLTLSLQKENNTNSDHLYPNLQPLFLRLLSQLSSHLNLYYRAHDEFTLKTQSSCDLQSIRLRYATFPPKIIFFASQKKVRDHTQMQNTRVSLLLAQYNTIRFTTFIYEFHICPCINANTPKVTCYSTEKLLYQAIVRAGIHADSDPNIKVTYRDTCVQDRCSAREYFVPVFKRFFALNHFMPAIAMYLCAGSDRGTLPSSRVSISRYECLNRVDAPSSL